MLKFARKCFNKLRLFVLYFRRILFAKTISNVLFSPSFAPTYSEAIWPISGYSTILSTTTKRISVGV